MSRYGCIGKTLTHSFSKEIHGRLADYEYNLIELTEEQLPAFLERRDFAAVNVTMPYKQAVIPYLDVVSDIARRIGAVNTVVHRNGKLYGYNTDYYGMGALIRRLGLDLRGKKVLILGTGGTAKTARAVATDMGAAAVLTVSRTPCGEHVSYEDAVTRHRDTQILINTTPSGMYPNSETCPIDVTPFSQLEGVVDAVYNPLCTNLVLDARARGIKAEGGLYMLVMQAVAAVERFLDITIDTDAAERVYTTIRSAKENIVLTGMPGCGKSTVGRLLAAEGYPFIDTDAAIEERCGCTVSELIATKGETYFRDMETAVIRDLSAKGGCVIATGGGAVLRAENVRYLKHNGRLFFLDTPLSRLQATVNRPLSDTQEKLAQLYAQRIDVYRSTADVLVPAMDTPAEEAAYILTKGMER